MYDYGSLEFWRALEAADPYGFEPRDYYEPKYDDDDHYEEYWLENNEED